ncbi:MAG: LysM peptidoglycan-binding domain-containing protein [Burkholderiaceae bacterium]|jgi:hypothetical protein|nr:LysM peptidoglycan-binding domain-containing protein [Burkholderiaceae bacterium]
MIASLAAAPSLATNLPVLPAWRATAEQVAQAGVPLAELAPNAPDSYTVKRGDTLWDISKLFLRSPWRWPELWGMNLEQVRNPHLIYPGQILVLERVDGRARLRLAQAVGGEPDTVKLSPRVREEALGDSAIPSIPMHLIAPFLNEAVVFDSNELAAAPRVVAAQEGRVMMSRGENAYVRGEIADLRDWRVFREAVPLVDPTTNEVLGFEARYVGSAEYVRRGEDRPRPDGKLDLVPATFLITSVREEVGIGDRLAPAPTREFVSYAPHAPAQPIAGRIVSVYGDGLNAGQNQIVALNRGRADGLEPGHVLALWRDGELVPDRTDAQRPLLKLPDERHGSLFVFRTFERVSYALILSVREPVRRGDRFTQP